MTTYRLTQQPTEVGLPIRHTIAAACIHTDDDFVRFHDDDHDLVYAVQRGLLLAIETVEDQEPDQDAQAPDPATYVTLTADTSAFEAAIRKGVAASNRWLLMRQFGWSKQQADELPDWLVSWLHDAH